MRANEFIVEYRNSLLQYVKRLLPTWPEYVLRDWLVPNKGDFSNLPDTDLKDGIMEKLKGAGLTPNSKWQLIPNMKFTMDMFDPMTKQRLIGRAGGKSDLGMGIPRDAERHATQAQLAQQQGGVRKEPVLLIKTDKGYELLEGWHRTIQHFHMYPDGYTGPAYVVVAQSQPVNEEAKAAKYNGLVMKYAFNDNALILKAFTKEGPLAYVKFVKEDKELYPQDLWVHDDYRNRGIAKSMYDYLKSEGYVINRSHDQTKAGSKFWDKHRGEHAYVWEEEVIDEMPLPADWDPQQYKQQGTTFKSRLQYALDRAKKLGTGSSRVATIIEYQGRPTVLKIAKNQKGLAQNSVEASILDDGYASQLGILIPLIDYDEQNREPSWIHTEMAQKASEKQLCSIMNCENLHQLVNLAWAITGKKKYLGTYQQYIDHLQKKGKTDQELEVLSDYANTLADLNSNFDVELGDFTRAANWGIYNGKPVIVDVGFNSNVLNQYYKR